MFIVVTGCSKRSTVIYLPDPPTPEPPRYEARELNLGDDEVAADLSGFAWDGETFVYEGPPPIEAGRTYFLPVPKGESEPTAYLCPTEQVDGVTRKVLISDEIEVRLEKSAEYPWGTLWKVVVDTETFEQQNWPKPVLHLSWTAIDTEGQPTPWNKFYFVTRLQIIR